MKTGGHLICPGRFLAKKIIISSCILLASRFDIKLAAVPFKFRKEMYGLGTDEPTNAVPFTIKMRDGDN